MLPHDVPETSSKSMELNPCLIIKYVSNPNAALIISYILKIKSGYNFSK